MHESMVDTTLELSHPANPFSEYDEPGSIAAAPLALVYNQGQTATQIENCGSFSKTFSFEATGW